jgi:TM2 domain-containing membrane protein YozV
MENPIDNNYNSEKPVESKRLVAALCAIFLGVFGVHKFILGYTTEGILCLVFYLVVVPTIAVITCGGGSIIYVIPIIEGVIYLTKTDEQFIETYQNSKKGWF